MRFDDSTLALLLFNIDLQHFIQSSRDFLPIIHFSLLRLPNQSISQLVLPISDLSFQYRFGFR